MNLETVTLTNFRQHRQREAAFSPYLNMIVGPNGSGKTNFLAAIRFAMTGEAGGEQRKLENIRQLAGHGEKAGVLLRLRHAGVLYRIRRMLRPATAEMVIQHGDESSAIRGTGKINKELWAALSITKKQLDDYIFVNQRQIDALIDKTETERAQELAILFGIDKAQKIWKELGEAVTEIVIPSLAVPLTTRASDYKKQQSQLEALQAESCNYVDVPDDITDYISDRQRIIDAYQSNKQLAARRQSLQMELEEATAELQEHDEVLAKLADDVATLDQGINSVLPLVEAARQTLTDWAVHEHSRAARAEWQTEQNCAMRLWRDRAKPTKPSDPVVCAAVDDDAIKAELIQATQAANAKTSVLAETVLILSREAANENCPTCGQRMPDLDARVALLAEKQSQLHDAQAESAEKARQLDLLEKYTQAKLRSDNYRTSLLETIRRLKRTRDSLVHVASPATTKNDANAIIAELEGYHKGKQQTADRLAKIREQRTRCESHVESVTTTIADIAAQLTASEHATAAAAATAQREIETMRLRRRTKQDWADAVIRGEVMAAEAKARLDSATATLLTAGRRTAAKEFMTDVRNVFHVNEAPRILSYTYLQHMEQQINETLGLFDSPFRVAANDALGFQANFLDGSRTVPDSWLSVGERVTLALAFRIAMNSTFANNLGILMMDEPAAGLDEHNLGCLPIALERLRAISQERGLQILFVTHRASQLGQYFDAVIDLAT